MSEIDYQALREKAEKADEDKWQAKKINGDFFVIRHGSYTRQHGYTSYQPIAEIDCKPVRDFVAKANPATVLELLDELEAAEKRIAELEARAFNPAILDVIAERQRQQSVEGWTPAHDDKHDNNEMAFAASCYAFHSAAASWDFEDDGTPYDIHQAPKNWPWDSRWWKPTSPRRDLVKAGALIIAEIERIDRATGIRIKGE
ncbi:ead/Ea22-like family protein [Escherichia coli]|nr:ead/Ea22-like family protein [Escherichia coli]